MAHFLNNNASGNPTATPSAQPTVVTPSVTPPDASQATATTATGQVPFYKTWWGITLQVLLLPITAVCWLVYWIIRFVREGLLDYLFMKVEREKDETGNEIPNGRIVKVKFISIPEYIICGIPLMVTPLIFLGIQHFFPDADIACAFMTFALIPLMFIVALYDLPTIKFLVIGVAIALASPFVSVGWSHVFGLKWEIFHLLNDWIVRLNPHLTARDYILESILWFLFMFPFAIVALFQKRYELANNEAYEVKLGKRTSIATWTDKITIDASATGEWILGVGKLIFKKGDGIVEIQNVPGLGSPLFRILYPWLIFKKSPRKAIEGLAERGDELRIG